MEEVQGSYNTKRNQLSKYVPWFFLLPLLTFYIIFKAIPICITFVLSFYKWDGVSFATMDFIGIQNYIKLLGDKVFWTALYHNIVFILIGVPLSTVFALFIAILLEKRIPLANFFRGTYFIPSILSMTVIGLIFTLLLSPDFGIINPLLKVIGLGRFAKVWLGDSKVVLFTLIIIWVWMRFGFNMFIFIAGLKNIPQEIYESAHIDGTNTWQDFRYITLPLLRPTIVIVVLLGMIDVMRIFDLVFVMTKGGPNNASQVLAVRMYQEAFTYNHMGYGSTIAVVFLLLCLAMSLVNLKIGTVQK